MHRADESLSVLHEYDQQRRTFREAVCEERAGAAAGSGATRQARGVILSTGQLRKSKGESVSGAEWRRAKRAGVQRRRTVSTDLHVSKTASVGGAHAARGGAPLSVTSPKLLCRSPPRSARFVHLRRTRTCFPDRLYRLD